MLQSSVYKVQETKHLQEPRADEKEMIDIHVVCHLYNIKFFWDGKIFYPDTDIHLAM